MIGRHIAREIVGFIWSEWSIAWRTNVLYLIAMLFALKKLHIYQFLSAIALVK